MTYRAAFNTGAGGSVVSSAPAPVIVVASNGPGLLVRVAWFVFIGWWVGAIATSLAWLCLITIILLPIGLMVINRLPSIVTLRPQARPGAGRMGLWYAARASGLSWCAPCTTSRSAGGS